MLRQICRAALTAAIFIGVTSECTDLIQMVGAATATAVGLGCCGGVAVATVASRIFVIATSCRMIEIEI